MDRLPTSIKGYMTARPSTSRIADNPPTRSCIADDLPMPSRGQCTTDAHCLAPRAPSITDSIPQSMIHSTIHILTHSIIYSLIHSVSPLIIHSILPSTIHSIIHSNIRSIILSVTHSVILYDHSLDTEGTPTGHPTRTPPILYSISHSLSHQVSP